MNAEFEEPTPATAPEHTGAVPTLAEVIETSPALVLDAPLYFVRSTFSFDYLLVPEEDEHAALAALERAGFPMDPRTAG